MITLENIYQYAQMLPAPLQREVLDFVKFLLFKQAQETTPKQDEVEWSTLFP